MPCRPISGHPQGSFQKQVVDDFFKPVDTAEFAGVAEDFCDFNMKKQTMDYLTGTEFMSKLRFITDGTAPIIPNAPHVVAQNEKAKKEGVQFITHETPFES